MTLKRIKLIVAGGACLLVLFLLEGCYYVQAARGQIDLMNRRRPVPEVIADEAVTVDLKERLSLVQEARQFAVDELLLPDNDSYKSYADLERDYVVWNVFAAPEFSLEAKRWCYPFVGCVAYRGYFDRDAAEKRAGKLAEDGYDVAVGGVAAYSTLGKFSDPVLNTMMRWSDVNLVATIFHELAHQKLYVKDDTEFNESFATAVAEVGIYRWLGTRGEQRQLAGYDARRQLRHDVMALVESTKGELEELYATDVGAVVKRERKRVLLDELATAAATLIADSGTGSGNWLAPPLNNARLLSLGLYEGRLPAFRSILAECDDALVCFYAEAERLAALGVDERRARLDELTAGY